MRSRRPSKSPRLQILAAATTLGITLTGCSPVNTDDQIVLKFADTFSATHPIGESATQPFLQYLKEHGPAVNMDVEYYASGQMGDGEDMPTLLRTDVVQIAPITPSNLSSQVPLSSVSELPGLVEDPCAAADALMPLMQEGGSIYENELRHVGVRPLWVAFVVDYEIMTSKVRIDSPDDVKGLLLRSNGGIADRTVSHLDAAGVPLSGGDLYEGLTRGIVGGAHFPPVSALTYNLDEVLRYTTVGADLGLSNTTYGISTQAWERLNDKQRSVITDASRIATQNACKQLPKESQSSFQKMAENGVELVEIKDDTRREWDAAIAPIREEWVRDLESIGRPARQVLRDFEHELRETTS